MKESGCFRLADLAVVLAVGAARGSDSLQASLVDSDRRPGGDFENATCTGPGAPFSCGAGVGAGTCHRYDVVTNPVTGRHLNNKLLMKPTSVPGGGGTSIQLKLQAVDCGAQNCNLDADCRGFRSNAHCLAHTGDVVPPAAFCAWIPQASQCTTAPGGLACSAGRCLVGAVCSAFFFTRGASADASPPRRRCPARGPAGRRPSRSAAVPAPRASRARPSSPAARGSRAAPRRRASACRVVPRASPGERVRPGPVPVDFVCSVSVFQGGSECNCLPSRAPCAATDCVSGGTCPGEQVCQRVVASGDLNLSLCLCVAAGSTCDTVAGTCPGACPAGQACEDRFTNPTHDCHCAP